MLPFQIPIWVISLINIIKMIPWGTIYRLAMDMIEARQLEIDAGELSGDEAREKNIELLVEATAGSPSIPKSSLRVIHDIAYLEYRYRQQNKIEEDRKIIRNSMRKLGIKIADHDDTDDALRGASYDPMSTYKDMSDKLNN